MFTVDSSLLLSNVLFLAISVWLYICFELYTSVSVSCFFPPDGLLVWGVSLNAVRGSSDRSLFFCTFVRGVSGGGGGVV